MMSTAEMKAKKEKLISVEAFVFEISGSGSDTSIESIYKKAVAQYHDTLLKLAQ